MPSASETTIQRYLTSAYVSADPFLLVIERPNYVSNGAGGFKEIAPTVLPSQTARLVPTSGGVGSQPTERQLADGEVVVVTHHLVAAYDIDIKRDDIFYKDGEKFKVVWITHPGNYETKAEVTKRG